MDTLICLSILLGQYDDQQVQAIAAEFKRCQETFREAERLRPDGVSFYPTDVLERSDIRDPGAWTRILLDRGRIDQLSVEVSQDIQNWLAGRGLLGEAQESGVLMSSLSIEVFRLTFRRPWLDVDVFNSRSWQWNEELLSDGGDPPKGLLPAYITQVILRLLRAAIHNARDAAIIELFLQTSIPIPVRTGTGPITCSWCEEVKIDGGGQGTAGDCLTKGGL